MMITKRRWLWVLLFIGVTLLLGGLATGWNIVLVLDHYNIVALAKNLALPPIEASAYSTSLIIKMFLGTLGFIITLAMTVLLFIKLLNEMRLNQLQSEFLATLSHELKTPIATLELSSSLIRAGDLPATEVNRLWKTHEEELRRLREEVEALLEAARWQSQSALMKMHPVKLESWIENSWERWKSILGPHAILTREGDFLDFKVPLDLRLMNLIMDNLMSNSRKFAHGNPHVIIRTLTSFSSGKIQKGRWEIQLEDHGWGFEPSDSRRIFNRFFRSKNLAPYAIAGTGLGLYLASTASRTMGLTLKGESPGKGKGTRFILEGKKKH